MTEAPGEPTLPRHGRDGNPAALAQRGPRCPGHPRLLQDERRGCPAAQTSLRSLRKLGCVAGHDGGKQSLHTRAFHRLGEGALGEHALEMKLRRRSCENIVDRFEIIGQRSASRLADRR